MELSTNNDWTTVVDDFDKETQVATTNDPRVLAVIRRDPNYPAEFLFEGDGVNPTYYITHLGEIIYQGGVLDNEVAAAFARARRAFRDNDVVRRHMRIFHDTQFAFASEPGDRNGKWVAFSTPSAREEWGTDGDHDAQADADSWAEEVQKWLNGDVWSAGYATLEGRVLGGDEIDYSDWDEVIGCDGLVGETYAKEESASFTYDTPDLPEMLEINHA